VEVRRADLCRLQFISCLAKLKYEAKDNEEVHNEMKCYFIRHGEIESNRKKIYAGWSEEALTSRGESQAEEVAKDLISCEIDRIYTSPLKRAHQTAEIIGNVLGKSPIIEESFKELRLGLWQGMHEDEVARQYPEEWRLWNTRPAELVLGGRETLHEMLDRVLAGLRKIKLKQNCTAVLVVTHLALIRVLLLHTQKMDLNLYRTISVPNAKIFEIEIDPFG